MTDKTKLKQLLDIDTDDALKLMEVCGMLVLMLHWQRGILNSLVFENVLHLNETQKANWERVIKNLALYEEFAWEILPPRAILLVLRQFRTEGSIPDNFSELLKSDTHGRIPYGLSKQEYDDIEDIIRKIKDSRQTTGFYGHGPSLLDSE